MKFALPTLKSALKKATLAVLSTAVILSSVPAINDIVTLAASTRLIEVVDLPGNGKRYTYEDFVVEYRFEQYYGGARRVSLKLTNTGTETIENFALYYDFGGTVTMTEECRVITNESGLRYLKSLGQYNADIAPGETRNFAYTLSDATCDFPDYFRFVQIRQLWSDDDFSASLAVTSAYEDIIHGSISLNNLSDSAVEAWELDFACNFTITASNSADAQVIETPAGYKLKGSWNKNLAANSTISLTFDGKVPAKGVAAVIEELRLSGVGVSFEIDTDPEEEDDDVVIYPYELSDESGILTVTGVNVGVKGQSEPVVEIVNDDKMGLIGLVGERLKITAAENSKITSLSFSIKTDILEELEEIYNSDGDEFGLENISVFGLDEENNEYINLNAVPDVDNCALVVEELEWAEVYFESFALGLPTAATVPALGTVSDEILKKSTENGTEPPEMTMKGDLNDDGVVTSADLIYLKRTFAGWAKSDGGVYGNDMFDSAASFYKYDMDSNGKSTSADITVLKRWFAGATNGVYVYSIGKYFVAPSTVQEMYPIHNVNAPTNPVYMEIDGNNVILTMNVKFADVSFDSDEPDWKNPFPVSEYRAPNKYDVSKTIYMQPFDEDGLPLYLTDETTGMVKTFADVALEGIFRRWNTRFNGAAKVEIYESEYVREKFGMPSDPSGEVKLLEFVGGDSERMYKQYKDNGDIVYHIFNVYDFVEGFFGDVTVNINVYNEDYDDSYIQTVCPLGSNINVINSANISEGQKFVIMNLIDNSLKNVPADKAAFENYYSKPTAEVYWFTSNIDDGETVWDMSSQKKITVPYKSDRSNGCYSAEQFQGMISHEIGHILLLGHAYTPITRDGVEMRLESNEEVNKENDSQPKFATEDSLSNVMYYNGKVF